MEAFLSHLRNREGTFTVCVDKQDAIAYMKKSLLSSPCITASIRSISYSYYTSFSKLIISFTIEYDADIMDYPVFLVRNKLELTTAVSLMYRLHASKVKIIIDNASHLISPTNAFSTIQFISESVDEELQIHQLSQSRSIYLGLFDETLCSLTLLNDYFDSAKAINDMSCIAAANAMKIRELCHGNEIDMLYMIHKWFFENIEYKDNDLISDHSAVGLLKSKQGVCQAIAAFAFQLLTYCGFDARDVHGSGNGANGWGAHAWNMVKVNNSWYHIDYTFTLKCPSPEFLVSKAAFAQDHRWDESKYSDSVSSNNIQTRHALDHSVITIVPDMPCYSVNGCIIDTSNSHPICIVYYGNVFSSIFDIVSISGGCYELKGNDVHIYFDHYHYKISTEHLKYLHNAWYILTSSLKSLNFRISISGNKIILSNQN